MTTPTNLAGRPRPTTIDSPQSTRVGLQAFPRHYTNIRWRMFLANRGIDSGWGYRLPAVYRSERHA